jgi:hypothetical protein
MMPDVVIELGWLNIPAYGRLALAPAVFVGGMTMRLGRAKEGRRADEQG